LVCVEGCLSVLLSQTLVLSSFSWSKLQNLLSALSITLREELEQADYTEPQVERNNALCASNNKEDERDDRYTKEDGGENHTNDVGNDEDQGGNQPGEQKPSLGFDAAVHEHDRGEKVHDQENDTNDEKDKHSTAQTFNLRIIIIT